MFQRDSPYDNLSRDELRYKSPEELFGKGRSMTTPFWVLGILLFEAEIGFNPWATTLKTPVIEKFIKYYPVHFPDEKKVSEDFRDLIMNLLIKNPIQRLGSDFYEGEILDHPYFNSD